jgi:hypothetical protein
MSMKQAAAYNDRAIKAHRATVNRSISEMAKSLQEALGTALLMYMLDVKDPKTLTRWANGQVETIRNISVERKLRAIDQMVEVLLEVESPAVLRGWFLGMNPTLDDVSPAEAVRDGKLSDALNAAGSYVSFAW